MPGIILGGFPGRIPYAISDGIPRGISGEIPEETFGGTHGGNLEEM